MYKFAIYFVLHFYYTQGEASVTSFINNNDDTELFYPLAECIKKISDQELKFAPTVVIDTQNVKNKTDGISFMEAMANKLTENNVPMVIISNETNTELLNRIFVIEGSASKRKYKLIGLVIIYFDTCKDVTGFKFGNINEKIKHLVVISDLYENNCIEQLITISKFVAQYDITFMMLDIGNAHYDMFTFIPEVDRDICKEIVKKPILINTCCRGILLENEVFPSKNPTNLNKCPLKVGMATLYPFAEIENKEKLRTYDHIDDAEGSDMEVMKIVTEYFNATLDLHYIYRKEENPFGDYEFLKFIMNGSLDVCTGGLYRIYGDRVEYSGIYARQTVIWIYYAERSERSWQNLIGKVNGLYIFVLFYVCYSIVWYIICLFDGDAVSLLNTLLYSWGALIGASSLQDAKTIKQKIINLGYLIMCIHLSAFISIQFYSFLTIRAPPKMFNTHDEIMESGRPPYLKSSTKYFINDKKYVEFANTSAECDSFDDCAQKTFDNNGLTVVLQANFYHFQSATAVNGEARILRSTENILTVYNEMLISKDSPLVTKFHKVIKSLFEAGITQYLYNKAVGILVMAKADSANSNMVTNSYSCQSGCSITLMQFAGAFYTWMIGCVLSFIVFILELCLKREAKPKVY